MASQEFAHAVQRLENILRRIGVGDAQIPFSQYAEIRAADQGDAGFTEQRVGQGLGLPAGLADIREGIEGALGRDARNPGQLVQAFHHDFPALVEFGHHFQHRLLRPGQRGDAGKLGGRIDAGIEVDRQLAGLVIEFARPYRIAQPPAGHGKGLGPAIEQDQPVADGRIAEHADMRFAIIDDPVIDLIRQHRDIGPFLQARDQRVEFGFRADAAGGIGG